jgi:hypothetical protein
VKLLSGIKSTPKRIDVRPGLQLWRLAPLALIDAGIFASGQVVGAALAAAAIILLLALSQQVVRLTADRHGLRILNWWNWKTFAWSEIADVTVRHKAGKSPSVLFSLTDGCQKRSLATLGGWNGSYTDEELKHVVRDLLRMRQSNLHRSHG